MILCRYTFQCRSLLFVLGQMLPPPDLAEAGTLTQAAAQLANTLSREVHVIDDTEILVELDEPVEAIALARELELRVRTCIASPLALELVLDPGAPARAAWDWLRGQLGTIAPPSFGIVKLRGIDRITLPAAVDQLPDRTGVLLWILGVEDRIELVYDTCTLGRGPNADLTVDDPTLSRVHAALVPYRGTWALQDRDSASGTYIDDRLVHTRCLVPGMVIRLGRTRIVVLSVR